MLIPTVHSNSRYLSCWIHHLSVRYQRLHSRANIRRSKSTPTHLNEPTATVRAQGSDENRLIKIVSKQLDIPPQRIQQPWYVSWYNRVITRLLKPRSIFLVAGSIILGATYLSKNIERRAEAIQLRYLLSGKDSHAADESSSDHLMASLPSKYFSQDVWILEQQWLDQCYTSLEALPTKSVLAAWVCTQVACIVKSLHDKLRKLDRLPTIQEMLGDLFVALVDMKSRILTSTMLEGMVMKLVHVLPSSETNMEAHEEQGGDLSTDSYIDNAVGLLASHQTVAESTSRPLNSDFEFHNTAAIRQKDLVVEVLEKEVAERKEKALRPTKPHTKQRVMIDPERFETESSVAPEAVIQETAKVAGSLQDLILLVDLDHFMPSSLISKCNSIFARHKNMLQVYYDLAKDHVLSVDDIQEYEPLPLDPLSLRLVDDAVMSLLEICEACERHRVNGIVLTCSRVDLASSGEFLLTLCESLSATYSQLGISISIDASEEYAIISNLLPRLQKAWQDADLASSMDREILSSAIDETGNYLSVSSSAETVKPIRAVRLYSTKSLPASRFLHLVVMFLLSDTFCWADIPGVTLLRNHPLLKREDVLLEVHKGSDDLSTIVFANASQASTNTKNATQNGKDGHFKMIYHTEIAKSRKQLRLHRTSSMMFKDRTTKSLEGELWALQYILRRRFQNRVHRWTPT